MPATRTKILLALSGGVDSAVCAHLLKEQGYDVRAVVMKMSELHEKTVAAAKEAAESLRIPLTVLDLRDVFRENVISYFIRSYQSGITPNPCVVCNPTVKFKYLIEEADRQGCAFAAIPVAVFQGSITAVAGLLEPIMTQQAVSNLSFTGSMLIFCVGVNLVWNTGIKVANMLPAIVFAVAFAFIL